MTHGENQGGQVPEPMHRAGGARWPRPVPAIVGEVGVFSSGSNQIRSNAIDHQQTPQGPIGFPTTTSDHRRYTEAATLLARPIIAQTL